MDLSENGFITVHIRKRDPNRIFFPTNVADEIDVTDAQEFEFEEGPSTKAKKLMLNISRFRATSKDSPDVPTIPDEKQMDLDDQFEPVIDEFAEDEPEHNMPDDRGGRFKLLTVYKHNGPINRLTSRTCPVIIALLIFVLDMILSHFEALDLPTDGSWRAFVKAFDQVVTFSFPHQSYKMHRMIDTIRNELAEVRLTGDAKPSVPTFLSSLLFNLCGDLRPILEVLEQDKPEISWTQIDRFARKLGLEFHGTQRQAVWEALTDEMLNIVVRFLIVVSDVVDFRVRPESASRKS